MRTFPTDKTWSTGTIAVPDNDYTTWTSGGRLTTGWHTLTSAFVHLTHRSRRELDELLEAGK